MKDIAETLPTRVEFSEQAGTVFEAELSEGGKLEMTLAGLEEHVISEVQENFSLLFKAPAGTPPAQGIYRLSHEHLGVMDIFLVPVKSDADGLYLEAVFNNFVAAA